jgi:hypothetical protein
MKTTGFTSYLPRALLVPWTLPSILFIAFSALLLAFLWNKGVSGIVGSCFLVSWLFKYAFVVLEHVANGRLEAPVASAEMLGPFETRPLILLAWCLALFAAARLLGGTAGAAVIVGAALLLPADIAILGLGQGLLESISPRTLWHVIRGLGSRYLLILALMAVTVVLVISMARRGDWNFWTIAAVEALVLTIFSATGGAVFERRLEIGHEPIASPERDAARADHEHSRRLGAMLDEVYVQARLRKHEIAMGKVQAWLAQADDARIANDARTIITRAATWNDAEFRALVAKALIAELKARDLPAAAINVERRAAPPDPS